MKHLSLIFRALCSASFCILLAGCQTNYVAGTDEAFVVIGSRSPSDVAISAPTSIAKSKVRIGATFATSDTLRWIDGMIYLNWKSTSSRVLPLGINDPLFGDIYYQMKDRSAIEALQYRSGSHYVGVVYKVDSQLRLIAAPAGSPVYILERPLTKQDGLDLEMVLKEMKFDPGKVDGVIDAQTRSAIGLYLEYRGGSKRPLNPVISTALFSELVGRLPK